jgi:hypothetical protein
VTAAEAVDEFSSVRYPVDALVMLEPSDREVCESQHRQYCHRSGEQKQSPPALLSLMQHYSSIASRRFRWYMVQMIVCDNLMYCIIYDLLITGFGLIQPLKLCL